MDQIELTLLEAADTRKLILQLNSEVLVGDLASFIASRLAGSGRARLPVRIYDPRRAVLAPGKSLAQYGVKDKSALRYVIARAEEAPARLEEQIVLNEDLAIQISPEGNRGTHASAADEIRIINSQSRSLFQKPLPNGSIIELIEENIALQKVDAIVNAANTELKGGGGVDGALREAAGPLLPKACAAIAPCDTGNAVLTPGYDLPAKWVIHAVGPIYVDGQHGEPQSLTSAYESSLKIAALSEFKSLALPAISAGVYGYPVREAAQIAITTVFRHLKANPCPTLVRFVLLGTLDYRTFHETLIRLPGE